MASEISAGPSLMKPDSMKDAMSTASGPEFSADESHKLTKQMFAGDDSDQSMSDEEIKKTNERDVDKPDLFAEEQALVSGQHERRQSEYSKRVQNFMDTTKKRTASFRQAVTTSTIANKILRKPQKDDNVPDSKIDEEFGLEKKPALGRLKSRMKRVSTTSTSRASSIDSSYSDVERSSSDLTGGIEGLQQQLDYDSVLKDANKTKYISSAVQPDEQAMHNKWHSGRVLIEPKASTSQPYPAPKNSVTYSVASTVLSPFLYLTSFCYASREVKRPSNHRE